MSIAIPQHAAFEPDTLSEPDDPAYAETVSFMPVVLLDGLTRPTKARTPSYVPEWARPDSPTKGMTDAQIHEHYKRTAIASHCRFALRDGSTWPADLQSVFRALLADVQTRAARPTDRKLIDSLNRAWRAWKDDRPYVVPEFVPTGRSRKAQPSARLCPHCGGAL